MTAAEDAIETLTRIVGYKVGDVVSYQDHQDRRQRGAICKIEITLGMFGDADAGHVFFTIWHPTYRNRRHYCGPDSISTPRRSFAECAP